MIATGGLLRINNARRQDSLRSKARVKPKKPRKKRTQEVVVVQGRVQVCSLSGLVALLGFLVLLVGGVLAVVGYCPQDLLFKERPAEGATNDSAAAQVELDGGFNSSHNSSLNLIQNLLQRFLDSDRLKVLGPLVMGVGFFLFLCANTVLLENRDKKTKVIKLQDIYSTVIDLHQTRDRTAGWTTSRTADRTTALSRKLLTSPNLNHSTKVNRDVNPDLGFVTRWLLRKGSEVKERREETREQGDEEEGGDDGAKAKWWTRRGCSLKERGDNGKENEEAWTKWWKRKGGSVRERREETREEGDDEEGGEKGVWTKWWTKKGGSVREKSTEVFSVCHEQRVGGDCGAGDGGAGGDCGGGDCGGVDCGGGGDCGGVDCGGVDCGGSGDCGGGGGPSSGGSGGHSLPRSFSFHRSGSQKGPQQTAHNEMKATNRSTWLELDAANQSTELDTSFSLIGSRSFSCSLIGSQRPLLLMMLSRASLDHAAAAPSSKQRRGSMLSHAPCISPAIRRSSCI